MNSNEAIKELEAQIAEVQNEIENTHGTQTEVYARIVGYYRAVRNWNKGKAAEFVERKMFDVEKNSCAPKTKSIEHKNDTASAHYELYVRKTCPNCPPVKKFMSNVQMSGKIIDVDTNEGLDSAATNGVFSSPTVIFYDENGTETNRCHSVEELQKAFSKDSKLAA